ncbi:unnamed protein product, partial [Sphenostylis stenocarpa]
MQGRTVVWCRWTTIFPPRPLLDDRLAGLDGRLPPTANPGQPSTLNGRPSGPNGHWRMAVWPKWTVV